jgi:hypothetical protein
MRWPALSLGLLASLACPPLASAQPISGTVVANTGGGPSITLSVAIDETTTRMVLTGPSYSWFAWGFGATTMAGYSVIVEGLDANRTVVEQNLVGIGDEGVPQATQNLQVVSTTVDAATALTTIELVRANNTGDPNDPVFDTSLTSVPMIWAYSRFASAEFPAPTLGFHTTSGRGFSTLTFTPIPEPAGVTLAAIAGLGAGWRRRR